MLKYVRIYLIGDIVMTIEHHSLSQEFPEHKELIHELKLNDNHFKRLFNEYDQLDHDIVRHEQEIEVICDERLEDLKKQRLKLKDELYSMLQAAKTTA